MQPINDGLDGPMEEMTTPTATQTILSIDAKPADTRSASLAQEMSGEMVDKLTLLDK